MNSRTEEDILNDINNIKKKINIQSTELQRFLTYLDQSVIRRGFLFCGPAKVTQTPEFMRAFSTLSSIQKGEYYLNCLRMVHELTKKQNSNVSTCDFEKINYEISFRLNALKEWIPTTITLDKQDATIFFQSSEKTIDLHHYILRHSKTKDHYAFVLESHVPKNYIETIRISHNNLKIFDQLESNVKSCIEQCLREKILGKLRIGKKNIEMGGRQLVKRGSISAQIAKGKQKKSLRELVQHTNANINFTINDFNAIASTLINRNIIENLDNYNEYQQITEGIFINHIKNRVRKVFYFNPVDFTKQWIIEQLTKYQNFKIWKNSLFMISLIASIPAQKTQIFHEINTYKDSTECDYVYLRHFFREGGKSYFIDKSISTMEYGSHESNKSRGNIEYCIWRIKQQSNKIQVLVQCQISHVECTDIYDLIEEQIGEIQKIGLSKTTQPKSKIRTVQDEDLQNIESQDFKEFTSYEGISSNERDQTEFYTIYNKQDEEVEEKQNQLQSQSNNQKMAPSNYRYQIQIQNNGAKQYKFMKNNRFFDDSECYVNENGDLLFVNQQKIKAQSSVLKKVLKKIGTNIFSGKSVLNISLPIQIFSSDTNLERLCKGNAYAPLFLQNKEQASPLQRMKAVISYSIGNILLYIQMAKPFNPILGETFQGYIDGCPIYGEQISHHPPISSFFMVGRGYFTHANLQAKVNFGLNNASGINEGYYKVAFDSVNPNKNVIAFVSPPGELSGLVLGDRKLALNSKTQYFDEKNQIFCEICWGKNKKQKQTNFTDNVEGKIVKLNKYQSEMSKIKISKQDQILGTISGRWTQKISFQKQVIFDVNEIKPFQVIQQYYPLQSDGKYRKDRLLVSHKKLEEAQKAKEQLEELQRKDRKLRKGK